MSDCRVQWANETRNPKTAVYTGAVSMQYHDTTVYWYTTHPYSIVDTIGTQLAEHVPNSEVDL